MGFQKSFPKRTDKSVYPRWEEVELSDAEEKSAEAEARKENIRLLSECLEDANAIFAEKGLKPYQTDIVNAAIALFDKRASHQVWWKEKVAKEKFDKEIMKK